MNVARTPTLRPRDGQCAKCAHCLQPIPAGRDDGYCCRGCKAVAGLLRAARLERYYDLRRGPGVPVAEMAEGPRDRKWLEPIAEKLGASEGPAHVALDLQGVHCTACVWLIETLFDRRASGTIEINPALGRAELRIDPSFPLEEFIDDVESFGYRVSEPNGEEEHLASDALLIRAGIALALAGNGMLLSAAIHLGLDSGVVYEWAREISFFAAVIAVFVGAPVFVRSAWAGLRRGVLHLDLPIALGMGLAFFGSAWSYATEGQANYVDTLTVFVALMLLGRFLQTRVLERNRRELLRDRGVAGLLTRRVREGRAELVPCVEIEPGDVLMLSPGDLVPVDASLLDAAASFSFDWIDGESRPRAMRRDARVPSGALLASDSAVRVEAKEPFATSEVRSLLEGTSARGEDDARDLAGLPKNIGGIYVSFVLAAAAVAAMVSWLRSDDLVLTLEIATATLVVTCPCAFGIAVPLAYEIVQSQLRRAGVFVRRSSVFQRALGIRRVVFDKTGTLTTGRLEIADAAPLRALDDRSRHQLYALAARSSHPKSRALARALEDGWALSLDPDHQVTESMGRGLTLALDESAHRLGEPSFALDDPQEAAMLASNGADLVYSVDGRRVLALETHEALRPEAARELDSLERAGLATYILSGDRASRCASIGASIGVPADRIFAEQSPEQKERFIEENDPSSVLMVGDGLNDARALARAGCSGTPSIERPFTAARCDFYFISPGLEAISRLLESSARLAKVVRADLLIALVYNTAAVSLAIAGLMRPWLAAILMPASSLGTIAFTVLSLRGRAALLPTRGGDAWKS
jgi:P-type Cu2+ transporter